VEGRITYYNEAAVEFSGRRPTLGSDSWCVTWRLYWPDGTPMRHDECPMAVALKEGRRVLDAEAIAERPDGSRVPFIPYPTPLYDESGKLVGAVNMLVDITERKRAEEQHDLLLREMSHRVKNLFSVTSGLVVLSARYAHTPEDVVEAVQQRMRALSVVHDLTRPGLTDAGEKGDENTTLDTLARAILAPYVTPEQGEEPESVSLSGPDVPVGGKAVASIALILHEFTTNAAKYGALSRPNGRVHIDWFIARDELVLTWRELNGPRLSEPPKESGFGSFFTERTVTSTFGGRLSRDWASEGLTIHLSLPLAAFTH
jgi:PAS domain S-box-containing protein